MNKDPLLSLAGIWSFQLDPGNCGESGGWFSGALPDTISLPGTTDEHQKGEENPAREPHHLTRIYPYVGAAFYQRELTIPERCTGKSLFLRIERTKHSTVWVDNTRIGEEDSLCTPHVYEVTDALSPGTHRITVRIDNSNLPPVGDGHQTSAHTQTNWNGLLGAVDILVKDPCFIEDLQRPIRIVPRDRSGSVSNATPPVLARLRFRHPATQSAPTRFLNVFKR